MFTAIRKDGLSSMVEEATINCKLNETDYMITVGSDAYFNCSNCSKDIQTDLKELIDYSDINGTLDNIELYFENNAGICE